MNKGEIGVDSWISLTDSVKLTERGIVFQVHCYKRNKDEVVEKVKSVGISDIKEIKHFRGGMAEYYSAITFTVPWDMAESIAKVI